MKRVLSWVSALGLVVGFAASAHAGGACCASKAKAADGKVSAACCSANKASAIACTDSDVPKMGYKIGDKLVTCPMEAKSLAAKDANAKMLYVVADKDYADEMEATKAYAGVLSSYMDKMLVVREVAGCAAKTCPVTGKTLESAKPAHFELASFSYPTKDAAEKAAATARAAAEKVQMKYVVADKEFSCPDEAKKSITGNQKIEYVVGDSKTCCDTMASVELAKARIFAAQQALDATMPKTAAKS